MLVLSACVVSWLFKSAILAELGSTAARFTWTFGTPAEYLTAEVLELAGNASKDLKAQLHLHFLLNWQHIPFAGCSVKKLHCPETNPLVACR